MNFNKLFGLQRHDGISNATLVSEFHQKVFCVKNLNDRTDAALLEAFVQ